MKVYSETLSLEGVPTVALSDGQSGDTPSQRLHLLLHRKRTGEKTGTPRGEGPSS